MGNYSLHPERLVIQDYTYHVDEDTLRDLHAGLA